MRSFEVIESLNLKKLTLLASDLNDLLGGASTVMSEAFIEIDIVREVLKSFARQPWSG